MDSLGHRDLLTYCTGRNSTELGGLDGVRTFSRWEKRQTFQIPALTHYRCFSTKCRYPQEHAAEASWADCCAGDVGEEIHS
jgi:hypothetical protein